MVVALFTALFWRPLKLSTFDEGFARTLGIRTGALGLALVIVAAVAAVAAFDAVGSIIVIAMFICPPAAARLMTNRLERQIGWSVRLRRALGGAGLCAGRLRPALAGRRATRSARRG